jgi:hypothetical protein
MKKITVNWSGALCMMVCGILTLSALAADPPASQPAQTNGDAERLTFLGDQLSADEAAIAAINKSLRDAGYHAESAADKIDHAQGGNELMNRSGGGPVAWRDFYGRTARDFIMHDTGSSVYHQVGRPWQFNYVYQANDDQIAKAQADIHAIGTKVDALLARRRQLEAEQSSLWATLAFESIQNRDISLRPLYRDQLAATPSKVDDNRPDGARVSAMRAAALYIKTIDRAVSQLADHLDADQSSTYASLAATLEQAQQQLRDSSATFADTPGVDPAEIQQMQEVVASARKIQSICKDVCQAFTKAQDADAAGQAEEQRKLLFRGTLQESLLSFAEAAGALDEAFTRMSLVWDIHGQPGTRSPDEPLAVLNAAGAPQQQSAGAPQAAATVAPPMVSSTPPAAAPSADAATPAQPLANLPPGQWTDVFNGHDLNGWKVGSNWSVVDGAMVGQDGDAALLPVNDLKNFRLRFKGMINDGVAAVRFRIQPDENYNVRINASNDNEYRTGTIDGTNPPVNHRLVSIHSQTIQPNVWFEMELTVNGPHITADINGQRISWFNSAHRHGGALGFVTYFWARQTILKVQKVQLMPLPDDGP